MKRNKMSPFLSILVILLGISQVSSAQKAEKQNSFARESQPHEYYVQQAELWWKEVVKDSTSEENWYNYFRACRNTQGTADWRTDFDKESEYLMQGDEIVKRIEKNLPNTFTYYYLSYLNHGIGVDNGENILKAYKLNPNFKGIHSSVISYCVSNFDSALRRKVNKEWYKVKYISEQSFAYNYNVLMSLDSNSILFTQNDNDTYPTWMLQDALGIRPDVFVLNIDFLLLDDYRDKLFEYLEVPAMDLGEIDQNIYRLNWQKVVKHLLVHYKGEKALYVGMTLFNELYKEFEKSLEVSGLAFRYYRTDKADLTEYNCSLYENVFLFDYINNSFYPDENQESIIYQNLNYLNFFKKIYDKYKLEGRVEEGNEIRSMILGIVKSVNNKEYYDLIAKEFD